MRILALALLILVPGGLPFAQGDVSPVSPVPPGLFDQQIQQMQFDQPTRIVGKFLSLDGYEDAIWIQWTHRYDGTRWHPIQDDMMFKVMPRDAGMMDFFRALKPGVTLHLTVQTDQDGNRRVLALDEEL